jgi:hypothetical protein
MKRLLLIAVVFCLFFKNYTFAQPYEFQLAPSGTTTDFMKFVPKQFTYNGTNYATGKVTDYLYIIN